MTPKMGQLFILLLLAEIAPCERTAKSHDKYQSYDPPKIGPLWKKRVFGLSIAFFSHGRATEGTLGKVGLQKFSNGPSAVPYTHLTIFTTLLAHF